MRAAHVPRRGLGVGVTGLLVLMVNAVYLSLLPFILLLGMQVTYEPFCYILAMAMCCLYEAVSHR